MIPALINILGGFVLASPQLKKIGGKDTIEKIERRLHPYTSLIGWLVFIVGVIVLIERTANSSTLQLLNGDSYPQAIPLILMGLLMLSDFFQKYPAVSNIISKLKPFAVWIGFWGIIAGLFSILGICPLC